jgi:hypothetical protein
MHTLHVKPLLHCRYGSDMLYVKGDNRLGVTAADIIAHRRVPAELLQELKVLQKLEVKTSTSTSSSSSSSSSSTDWVHDRGRQQQQQQPLQQQQQPLQQQQKQSSASASAYSLEERDKDFFMKAFAQFQHCTDLYIQRMRLILHHVSTTASHRTYLVLQRSV